MPHPHTIAPMSHFNAVLLVHGAWCQGFDNQATVRSSKDRQNTAKGDGRHGKAVTVLHGAGQASESTPQSHRESVTKKTAKPKAYCAYCESTEHYLSQCSDVAKLSKDQLKEWIQAAQCTLKKPCNICQGKHLLALHEINVRADRPNKDPTVKEESCLTSSTADTLCLDRPGTGHRVMLKVVPVLLHYGEKSLDTFAILDDGSERTMLLPVAAKSLGIRGTAAPRSGAFTASRLSLAQHTYPIDRLQRKFKHLRGLPLPAFNEVKPTLLIDSDQPHLITPVEPVRLGPPGLGGHFKALCSSWGGHLSLHNACSPLTDELFKHVERLWKVDTLPHQREKEVTRSKQDKQAIVLLEANTIRTDVDGVLRYATPLLRHTGMPQLHAPKESVMPLLRSTERRLLRNPEQADAYKSEMQKLIEAGVYLGQTLNQYLLPGPAIGASLLGVLVRFREQPVAVSGDIKGMFHQVRLLPDDGPLLRFLWRDLKANEPPRVFEWQVLPFGTTCSPCCATYALHRHVIDYSKPNDNLRFSSVSTTGEAKLLVDRLRDLLASAGFQLCQWACNDPSVLSHLPQDARSESLDLWLAQDKSNPLESTLGLSWNWQRDSLGYKHRPVVYETPTLRNIYKVVATQYDTLGYLLSFSTRAKLIIRKLWDKQRGWDDSNLPSDLLQAWSSWEAKLKHLPCVAFPRAYVPVDVNQEGVTRELHIFADASEQAYGAVAYMRTEDADCHIHLSFILARSRVAPKRMHSIPRLELCAALVAAQLACVLERELTLLLLSYLTLKVACTVLWSDSTTVLTWLHSQSCRYKVFVGARVAEIQELTESCVWRYVDTANNPVDDLTRGKALESLVEPSRWSHGPPFLLQSADTEPPEDNIELRKAAFCGVAATSPETTSAEFQTWQALIDATAQEIQPLSSTPSAAEYQQAEVTALQRAQEQSFPADYSLLTAGKPVLARSSLLTLAPEMDKATGLIRVGGGDSDDLRVKGMFHRTLLSSIPPIQ
ncbi:hypothetical protein N1851_025731 [Merluccius polli]|uniref:Uncharacterized protein n=1 Tax=Merluccius polli TaxID=89951 RepID=A0AA47MD54_MERPO|nr:hypothetical protein N1851_025731 [Merluccius polli]